VKSATPPPLPPVGTGPAVVENARRAAMALRDAASRNSANSAPNPANGLPASGTGAPNSGNGTSASGNGAPK
jgi:hypothetical protein